MDWNDYISFSKAEFDCKCDNCGGANEMDEHFISRLQDLRDKCGFPFRITSGYRCPLHPIEAAKKEAGRLSAHSTGLAADIAVRGSEAFTLIKHATDLGFVGLGVAQKGDSRFIHLDMCSPEQGFPRPYVWSY